jgi:hypothetical protein
MGSFVLQLISFLNKCQGVYYSFQDEVFYGWDDEGNPFEVGFPSPSNTSFILKDLQTGKKIEVDEGGNVKKW